MVYCLLDAVIPGAMLEHGAGSRPALPKEAFEEHSKTGRLPPQFVPQNWAFHAQCKMPDLIGLGTACLFAVSSRLRALLESYAPGDIEYIPMHIDISANMDPAEGCFCINVLRMDRQINFSKTPLGRGTLKGKEAKPATGSPIEHRFIFKMRAPHSPNVWREESFESEDFYYWADPCLIWISDQLHDAIEKSFPGQMRAYKQTELD